MLIKKLEKLILERHYRNDPVILQLLVIAKNQEKRIKKLEEALPNVRPE